MIEVRACIRNIRDHGIISAQRGWRRLAFPIRAITSLSLIGYILYTTDLNALWQAARQATASLLLLAFLLHGVGYLLSAWRWRTLLQAQGHRVPTAFLVQSYLVATFFNHFLPTTIGGDVVRAHDTARHTGASLARTLGIVTVDRLTGLFTLFLLACLAFLLGIKAFIQEPTIQIGLGIMLLLFALIALLLHRRGIAAVERLLTTRITRQLGDRVRPFYQAVLAYKRQQRAIGRALAIALLLQINVVMHYYLLSLALRQGVSLGYFFLIVPILLVILQVVPSINGIGYRETGFILLLARSDVEPASALSLALFAFGMQVLLGLIGGMVFIFRREPAQQPTLRLGRRGDEAPRGL